MAEAPAPVSKSLEGELFNGADAFEKNFKTDIVKVKVGAHPDTNTFHAHSGILCKSSFFSRALNGGFREAKSQEVELPEDDPEVFSSVLEFLYGEEYSPRLMMRSHTYTRSGERGILSQAQGYVKALPGYYNAKESPEQFGAAALRHAKIYCLADKLGIVALQALVLEKLRLCGPLHDLGFYKIVGYLVENSSDYNGEVSALLKPYAPGIPKA